MKFWILIILGGLLEVIGDIYFKKSNYIIGLTLYLLGTGFWAWSLQFNMFTKSIVIFTIINLLLGALLGYVIFNDILTSSQWLGIFFGFLCLILLR